MLNLNSRILRDPLTVQTIATPLVTAALAAFVPELGKQPTSQPSGDQRYRDVTFADAAPGVTFVDGVEMLPGLLPRHRRLGCGSRSRCGSSRTSGGAPGVAQLSAFDEGNRRRQPRDALNPLIQEIFAPDNM